MGGSKSGGIVQIGRSPPSLPPPPAHSSCLPKVRESEGFLARFGCFSRLGGCALLPRLTRPAKASATLSLSFSFRPGCVGFSPTSRSPPPTIAKHPETEGSSTNNMLAARCTRGPRYRRDKSKVGLAVGRGGGEGKVSADRRRRVAACNDWGGGRERENFESAGFLLRSTLKQRCVRALKKPR